MARTPTTATIETSPAAPNGGARPRRHRAPRTEPRKVSVLFRAMNDSGVPITSGVNIELVTVSSDKRKLYEAVMADRSLIAVEYTYPAKEKAIPGHPEAIPEHLAV